MRTKKSDAQADSLSGKTMRSGRIAALNDWSNDAICEQPLVKSNSPGVCDGNCFPCTAALVAR